MPEQRDAAISYARSNNLRFLDELFEFLRIPSISTDPSHKDDMLKAADWLKNSMTNIGMEKAQVFSTAGHPVVYSENLNAGSGKPTVLIYGHYDVQPPDPLDLWKSGPFSPVIQDDLLFARGSSDMKGQIQATLKAVESLLKLGNPPVNVKFLVEGEEEIGSPNLADFFRNNKELLASNVCLNPDTGMISADKPTIVYALRGLAYFELRVYGPDHDLHSGMFGGVILNPAQALCDLIHGMHDEFGRVTFEGFYDKVQPINQEERTQLARLPLNDEFYITQSGAARLWGEPDFTPTERIGARPTLEVNGLLSGFIGEGSKTVLPAWAMAKISTRLVPDQDPVEVGHQLRAYLERNAPPSIRWELTTMQGSPGFVSELDLPAIRALAIGLEQVWHTKPVYKREGGSIPMTYDLKTILGIDSALTGFGLPEDNIHSPNERLHLPTWKRGIEALIHFFYNYGSD